MMTLSKSDLIRQTDYTVLSYKRKDTRLLYRSFDRRYVEAQSKAIVKTEAQQWSGLTRKGMSYE